MKTHIQPVITAAPGSRNRRKHPSNITITGLVLATLLVAGSFLATKLSRK